MDVFLDSLPEIATLPNHVCHGHTHTDTSKFSFCSPTPTGALPTATPSANIQTDQDKEIEFAKTKAELPESTALSAQQCLSSFLFLLFKQTFVYPDFGTRSNYRTAEHSKPALG